MFKLLPDKDLDSSLYGYILCNIGHISPRALRFLLQEHELNLLARHIARKFPDSSHSESEIKVLIKEEMF